MPWSGRSAGWSGPLYPFVSTPTPAGVTCVPCGDGTPKKSAGAKVLGSKEDAPSVPGAALAGMKLGNVWRTVSTCDCDMSGCQSSVLERAGGPAPGLFEPQPHRVRHIDKIPGKTRMGLLPRCAARTLNPIWKGRSSDPEARMKLKGGPASAPQQKNGPVPGPTVRLREQERCRVFEELRARRAC